MVGTRRTVPSVEESSYIRKIRKPMVEKQRRERMNHSISQLKVLIANTIKQNTAPMSRVDKADILELTVYHLAQLQQQQRSVAMATEVAAYKTGYKECAREAVTYISTKRDTGHEVSMSLSNHLHSTFLMNSGRQYGGLPQSQSHGSLFQRQEDRLSTPVRPGGNLDISLPELNLSGYSPIQDRTQTLPELTSSFVHAGLNSSSSTEYSSTSSSMSVSSNSSRACSDCCTVDVEVDQESTDSNSFIDVVTIGNGKENEIGHVIKEVPWRPF